MTYCSVLTDWSVFTDWSVLKYFSIVTDWSVLTDWSVNKNSETLRSLESYCGGGGGGGGWYLDYSVCQLWSLLRFSMRFEFLFEMFDYSVWETRDPSLTI